MLQKKVISHFNGDEPVVHAGHVPGKQPEGAVEHLSGHDTK